MRTIKSLVNNSEQYWAHKPYDKSVQKSETLEEHSNLVLNYVECIIDNFGLKEIIKKLLKNSFKLTWSEEMFQQVYELFIESIYLHDLGKINPNFQVDKMENHKFKKRTLLFNSDHSFPGYILFIHHKLKDATAINNADEFEYFMVLVFLFGFQIAKHHASHLDDILSYLNNRFNFSDDDNKRYIQDVDKLRENTCIKLAVLQLQDMSDISSIIRDRLREGLLEDFPLFALLKLHYSLLTSSDYLATTHYMNNWHMLLSDYGTIDDELRTRIVQNVRTTKDYNQAAYDNVDNYEFMYPTESSNKNLNRLRQELSVEILQNVRKNKDKKVYYIEAPTGGGKTNLSILAAAEILDTDKNISNLYFIFPFTTLITQTYDTVKETMGLSENEIIQMHSRVGLKENDDQYGLEKKNHIDYLFINYPVALMSHVKFFNILNTNRKEANYLLHRLANSIVIVDELQSYPPKIWDKLIYFIQNFAYYFNVRFILMSATLPKLDKLSNVAKNICYLTKHRKEFFQNPNFCKRVEFDFSLLNWQVPDKEKKTDYLRKLATFVVKKSVEYAELNPKYPKSVFTIIEFIFKQTATEFYTVIQETSEGYFDEIFVLSGTILEARRKEIIYYLKNEKNRGKKIILITTQVVEAGVDIDMDLGFKDKSLVDSDEQLAGRINRNIKKPACKLYLFNCDNAEVLYKGDKRFQLLQNELSGLDREILISKDFDLMYNQVMEKINIQNRRIFQHGFSDFQRYLKELNFTEIDKNFQIINHQSSSVFVPISLPVFVPGTNKKIRNFSEQEFNFLLKYKIVKQEDLSISGEAVFNLYEQLITHKENNFITIKTELKKLQGVMSQFIFSLMTHSKSMSQLIEEVRGEERLGLYYLSHWYEDGVYNYDYGLTEKGEPAIIL